MTIQIETAFYLSAHSEEGLGLLLRNVHMVSRENIVSTAKQTQKIKRDKTDLFLRLRRCFSVDVIKSSSKARYKSAHLVVVHLGFRKE